MEKKWWHDKIAYQIYPKSFYDSNNDGIGDIRGIIEKLDYLKDLGIDIIWLSPVYQSPFVDQGYDISDYYGIAKEFGSLEDIEMLIEEMKKRDMYLIMDLVINHCSDKHPYFVDAINNPESEYRDYFYFRKGNKGKEPNNMRSYFGGNCWEKVPGRDEYYLHMFAKEQPDINWENPVVLEKLYKMINWWFEKGIAGFRIDAIINIQKDLDFPMYEPDADDGMAFCIAMVESVDGIDEKLEELKKNTFEKYDAFTVGEVFNIKDGKLKEFIGESGHFSSMFDFSNEVALRTTDGYLTCKVMDFDLWRKTTFESQIAAESIGFLSNIIENHDEPRGVNRYLPDYARNDDGKKMLATIQLLLKGIPFIYQGQEIGMENIRMSSIDEYEDIQTINNYNEAINLHKMSKEEALSCVNQNSRDNARTPMQWSSEANAGFSEGTPWFTINPNYREINVEKQLNKDNSVIQYYKELIALRKKEEYKEALVYGKTIPCFEKEYKIMSFDRKTNDMTIRIITNFGEKEKEVENQGSWKIILSNMGKIGNIEEKIQLASCEAIVLLKQ